MQPDPARPASAVPAAVSLGLDDPGTPEAAALAAFLARAFGPACAALVHYGSHVTAGAQRPGSALDFFVVVDGYEAAYASVVAHADTGMSPARAARLARLLPPNVVSVTDPQGGAQAKCAVYSLSDFRLACSERAPDHFAQGRLFQQVQLLWARGADERRTVAGLLVDVRLRTLAWGRPSLPAAFDAPAYCRALLDRSFAAEIRPENADRTTELLAGQAPVLYPAYAALLAHFAAAGELVAVGAAEGSFRLARPVTAGERARWTAYFARSKARATLRWAKYMALYDDWLDYVVKKVERRTGQSVQLTPRERRWPLVFLWPRAIRFLRDRPQARRSR
ncbi:MAG: hypothetical protein JWM27_5009 [Gemmatimonadetes bacterium]|nr:hypothetical protein [Gemmatimonadota bacterium]